MRFVAGSSVTRKFLLISAISRLPSGSPNDPAPCPITCYAWAGQGAAREEWEQLQFWRTLQRARKSRILLIGKKAFRARDFEGVQNCSRSTRNTRLLGRSCTGVGHFPLTPFNRPMSAHSTVMSPWSGQCSSHPFFTRGMRTSRDFWARFMATYKVLTTLTLVECSQVRQIERKEEIRACPATMRD